MPEDLMMSAPSSVLGLIFAMYAINIGVVYKIVTMFIDKSGEQNSNNARIINDNTQALQRLAMLVEFLVREAGFRESEGERPALERLED